ncbi:hypothetical protein, partial [Micromonospora sp. NPDC003776]
TGQFSLRGRHFAISTGPLDIQDHGCRERPRLGHAVAVLDYLGVVLLDPEDRAVVVPESGAASPGR